jgi:hypothetical protein
MGLPIRRHSDRPKGMVLAFTEEIDAWMRSETIMMRSSSESDVARLRKRLIEVMFENTTLRAEVDRLQKTPIQLVSTVGSDPALATKPSATALSESNPPN